MKLVSVGRAFKELQNDTPFSSKLFSVIFKCRTGTLSVCICIYNNIRYSLTKKIPSCSSFKALSTDTSVIKFMYV